MLIAVAVVLLLLVFIVVGMYNGLVRLKVQCDNAWSDIDVQLKRRYDLIPNLVETVKGYAAHEKGTLEGRRRRPQSRDDQPGPRRKSRSRRRTHRSACARCLLSPKPTRNFAPSKASISSRPRSTKSKIAFRTRAATTTPSFAT